MGISGLNKDQLEKAKQIAIEEGCRLEMKEEGSFEFLGSNEAETRVSRRIQREILKGVVTM